MAVPKQKISKSRRGQRRSHDALKKVNVVIDPTTGEYKLPHHLCKADGTYKGRQVIVENDNDEKIDETEAEVL
ncbi:50S ribosomal protein L32 [Rickettsiales bacterium]|nr:50S ribosomal protein L32 [Rickettsiales bacterium]